MIKAVLWDFGGVITTSPFEAFNRYEQERGLPVDFIRSVNATNPDNNAWAQLEQNRIDLAEFDVAFARETAAAGHRIAGTDVLQLLSGDVRPSMVTALTLIKQRYRVACITNNVQAAGSGPGMASDNAKAQQIAGVLALFDFVLESSVVGVRKPDPRIYTMACEKLEVDPNETVFIDDLGVNLKPARAMGMTTIKVRSQAQALAELAALLELPELMRLP
ncbi:MAG: HAD-IA family hydrolase [Gammaproteobacteria bacterium]|jgi:putative hydrolase of the HAD superfamily|nr:HAD-IA family hydrolase [Gammaproteobacteria bacterium]